MSQLYHPLCALGDGLVCSHSLKQKIVCSPGTWHLVGAAGQPRACRLFHSGLVPRVEIGLDLAPTIPQVSPLNSLLSEHWRVTRGFPGLYA